MDLPDFKNLRSLEVCGGSITDAGVKNIKDLTSLTLLNLSQNGNLTNKTLELISGMTLFTAVFEIWSLLVFYLLLSSIFWSLFTYIVGLTSLVSLNVSSSRVTSAGLQHLKPLKNLRSLSLESCKVTATDIKKLQLAALPNLVNFRPE